MGWRDPTQLASWASVSDFQRTKGRTQQFDPELPSLSGRERPKTFRKLRLVEQILGAIEPTLITETALAEATDERRQLRVELLCSSLRSLKIRNRGPTSPFFASGTPTPLIRFVLKWFSVRRARCARPRPSPSFFRTLNSRGRYLRPQSGATMMSSALR